MLVTLYIYRKSDGVFLYQDIGNPNNIIADLGDDKDFTLTPPPSHDIAWYWVGHAWYSEPNPTTQIKR